GLQAINQRTSGRSGLPSGGVEDLGGEAAVSAQQMALVEAAVRTRLYVDSLDAWILEHGSLVNARRRSLHPVVRERQQLVDSLARLLSLLGLERRPPKAVDLTAYLRERYGGAQGSGSQPPDSPLRATRQPSRRDPNAPLRGHPHASRAPAATTPHCGSPLPARFPALRIFAARLGRARRES